MKLYPADKIKNLVLLGHGGSGKTTLAEAMLFQAKVIDRMGKTTDGNTVMDFDPEEIRRQISLNTTMATCEYEQHKINIIDTPGDFDFVGEVLQGVQVADAALILVSAKEGVSVGSDKAFNLCRKKDLPFAFVINRMDEANANFEKALASLREGYGQSVVPLMLPIVEQEKMIGLVDVITKSAFTLATPKVAAKPIDVPADLADELETAYDQLIELVAETDEELMEKFFDGEEFTETEIADGIKHAITEGLLHPVFAGSGSANWGAKYLLDQVVRYLPSAQDRKPISTADGERTLPVDPQGPLAAFVFKTISDPFVGHISMFRVFSGTLSSNTTLYNPQREKDERIGTVFQMVGKKQINREQIGAGDIGCVSKLAVTMTNDTLCERSDVIKLPEIIFPTPCLSMAIYPQVKGEEDKIVGGLNRLKAEDSVFTVVNDPETRQIVVTGIGEQQLDVLRTKLKAKYNVDAYLEEARVPYRETIKKKVRVQGRHKKQTGGHGQYGDVWIEFEPGDEEALVFEQKIFGGSVPKSYHPAVEKGLQEAIQEGVLAGYPVVHLKATLVDGSYHDVDSSEIAFKLAARLAYRAGLPQASPVLLEPISQVEVHIPDDFLGDIMGDMNKRRGRIMGVNPDDEGQVVEAEVPTSEMGKYASDLKSMTQGRGWYTIQFARYEQAPQIIADKVIAEAASRQEKTEE